MDHTSIPDPLGFADLSADEQIRYLQAVWDRIIDGCEIPVPVSHLALVEERLADYRRDPAADRTAYEVLDRLAPEE